MAENTIRNNYKDIADAIRAKKGTSDEMTPAEMPAEIASITTGITPKGTQNIYTPGSFDVTTKKYANVTLNFNYGNYPAIQTKKFKYTNSITPTDFEWDWTMVPSNWYGWLSMSGHDDRAVILLEPDVEKNSSEDTCRLTFHLGDIVFSHEASDGYNSITDYMGSDYKYRLVWDGSSWTVTRPTSTVDSIIIPIGTGMVTQRGSVGTPSIELSYDVDPDPEHTSECGIEFEVVLNDTEDETAAWAALRAADDDHYNDDDEYSNAIFKDYIPIYGLFMEGLGQTSIRYIGSVNIESRISESAFKDFFPGGGDY